LDGLEPTPIAIGALMMSQKIEFLKKYFISLNQIKTNKEISMQNRPLIDVVFETLCTKTATVGKVNIPATPFIFKGCSRL